MEGDIGRSHLMTSVRKVSLVAFLCPEVAEKYPFEGVRGELGHGRRVIWRDDTTRLSITHGPVSKIFPNLPI